MGISGVASGSGTEIEVDVGACRASQCKHLWSGYPPPDLIPVVISCQPSRRHAHADGENLLSPDANKGRKPCMAGNGMA